MVTVRLTLLDDNSAEVVAQSTDAEEAAKDAILAGKLLMEEFGGGDPE